MLPNNKCEKPKNYPDLQRKLKLENDVIKIYSELSDRYRSDVRFALMVSSCCGIKC